MSGEDLAAERADHVIPEHDAQTKVPATFFDDLLDALDEPVRPNPAPARAAKSSPQRDLDFRL